MLVLVVWVLIFGLQVHQCDDFQVKKNCLYLFSYNCPSLPFYLKAQSKLERNSQQGNAVFFIGVIHIESERLLSQAQFAVCHRLKPLTLWDYTRNLLKDQKILLETLESDIEGRFVACSLHKNKDYFFLRAFIVWLTNPGRHHDFPWLVSSLSSRPTWSLKHLIGMRGELFLILFHRGTVTGLNQHCSFSFNMCCSWCTQ